MFSGDLVLAGGLESHYSAFGANIAKQLHGYIARDRVICVPGNYHDISQDALRPLATLQMGSLATLTSETTFNDNVPQLSKFFSVQS